MKDKYWWYLAEAFMWTCLAVLVLATMMSGCAARHFDYNKCKSGLVCGPVYSSTDRKIDPDQEQYMGTRLFNGHYHDLYCRQDQRTGDRVCRFE